MQGRPHPLAAGGVNEHGGDFHRAINHAARRLRKDNAGLL
jgi:hypothetical protein